MRWCDCLIQRQYDVVCDILRASKAKLPHEIYSHQRRPHIGSLHTHVDGSQVLGACLLSHPLFSSHISLYLSYARCMLSAFRFSHATFVLFSSLLDYLGLWAVFLCVFCSEWLV